MICQNTNCPKMKSPESGAENKKTNLPWKLVGVAPEHPEVHLNPLRLESVTYGLAADFLKELKQKSEHVGERAGVWNEKLQESNWPGRVFRKKLPHRDGQRPWVATRATFRQVYAYV